MSGTGVVEAEKRKVLTPGMVTTGLLFKQANRSCTLVGGRGALGVSAKMKLCAAPAWMSTGVFGEPVS